MRDITSPVSGFSSPIGQKRFSVRDLFRRDEPGVWYDPSDLSTMFQDRAGTTPVTAPGQTVGLVLDKSRGLVLGPEQLTNGDFEAGATGWEVSGQDGTHVATFSGGTLRYQSDTTSPQLIVSQFGAMTIGKTYLVEVVTSAYVSGAIKTDNLGANFGLSAGLGTLRAIGVATSTSFAITRSTTNVDLTIESISVRELPGNHLTANADAARGLYQVDETGRPYILFDGADDGYVTPTITPGTDKVQVFAGVRKLSDATDGVFAEFTDSGFGNGRWAIEAPTSAGSPDYTFISLGTVAVFTFQVGNPAPNTAVLSGTSDIGSDLAVLRVNGVIAAINTSDQGSGNFLAYPLSVGRRINLSREYQGRLYSLIVRFGPNLDAARISEVERFVNTKTGAY